ncbi:Transcription initiation factor TFIID subunit 11-like protein [Drosera capensis]
MKFTTKTFVVELNKPFLSIPSSPSPKPQSGQPNLPTTSSAHLFRRRRRKSPPAANHISGRNQISTPPLQPKQADNKAVSSGSSEVRNQRCAVRKREVTMKQSKDPFEVAFEEQEESPPDSPLAADDSEFQNPAASSAIHRQEVDGMDSSGHLHVASTSAGPSDVAGTSRSNNRAKEEDEDDEEDNMDVELGKLSTSTGDPDKLAKMQAILSQFTEQQMNRYESFRRSGFQKSSMKRLLVSITGSQKISMPTTIVVSGIAKMFVGELVETARVVMTERRESGPIRPSHIREAYRRLKLEGKVPKRSVPRLFR